MNQADQPINLQLTVGEVSAVLAALGEMPWKTANQVIQKIALSTQSQIDAANAQPDGAKNDEQAG